MLLIFTFLFLSTEIISLMLLATSLSSTSLILTSALKNPFFLKKFSMVFWVFFIVASVTILPLIKFIFSVISVF